MNFTDMLRKAVSLGLTAIERDDDDTIDRLRDEVSNLAGEIEEMFKDWDEPPPGIEEMVAKMDEAHIAAGESYLAVCDLIDEGLEDKRKEPLEEALSQLDEAVLALQRAEKLVHTTLRTENQS